MQLTHLEAVVALAIVLPQISRMSSSSPDSVCPAAVATCMTDLCRLERSFVAGDCEAEGCQIKGSGACNLTFRGVLDQFPSLRGCVCSWEEQCCGSIQALASQCLQQTVSAGGRSCLNQIELCLKDSACNRRLAPVLQACSSEQCDRDLCPREIQRFYGSMSQSSAEMLAMCECEASDRSCLHMKAGLQSGACGDGTLICQERLRQCVQESYCRNHLKTFIVKCWNSGETECKNQDEKPDECFEKMDSFLILGYDSECKKAFLATLGTVLHHPCTCQGVHHDHLQRCSRFYEVFHNRRIFITLEENRSPPSNPHQKNKPEEAPMWSSDHLLYVFAALLFAGVFIVMPLTVKCTYWWRQKAEKQHPQKMNLAIL